LKHLGLDMHLLTHLIHSFIYYMKSFYITYFSQFIIKKSRKYSIISNEMQGRFMNRPDLHQKKFKA